MHDWLEARLLTKLGHEFAKTSRESDVELLLAAQQSALEKLPYLRALVDARRQVHRRPRRTAQPSNGLVGVPEDFEVRDDGFPPTATPVQPPALSPHACVGILLQPLDVLKSPDAEVGSKGFRREPGHT